MADGVIDVVVNRTTLARSIDQAFAASRTLQKPINLKLNARGFSQPLGKIRADLNEFDKSLDAASARVLAFGASVGVINGVSRAFRNLVKDTIAVEKALTEINVVLGASASQLQQFGRGLFDVARNTQQSFAAAAEAATEFSRQGLSLEQTLKRTNDALILTRLSGLDAAKAVETLTAAVNGFSDAALTTSEVVNRLAAVDAAFAVSSQDLAEALSRAGSSAQDANVQFNELLALTTSVQQQTARGGAVIGNAFKTIFARISRGTSIDQLRELGVAIDETQTGVERLRVIGQAIENTDGITANKIKEIAGGVRQINIISAAFRDLNRGISLFDGALDAASTATDEAEIKISKLNETLAALVNSASVNIQELASTLGDIGIADNLRGLLQSFNSIVGGIVDIFNSSGIGTEIGKIIVSGIGNFLTGPGLVAAAGVFVRIFKQVAKDSIDAVRSVGGLNKEAERQANLQKVITQILTSQNSEYQALLRNATSQAEKEQVVLSILNQQLAAQRELARTSSSLAGSQALRGFNVSRGGGITRTPNAASGILPTGRGLIGALAKETAAISQGVGGASSSSKAVVIPNFNFGNGKTGPLVANTDEYILKNADGKGGSAILTKEMVRELGGAKAVEKLGGTRIPTAQDGTVDRRLFQRASEAASQSLINAFKTPSLTTNLGEAFGDTLDRALVNVQNRAGTTVSIDRASIANQDARVMGSDVLRQGGLLDVNSRADQTLRGIEEKIATQNREIFNNRAVGKFDSDQRLTRTERSVVRSQLTNQEFAARGLSRDDISKLSSTPRQALSSNLRKVITDVDRVVTERIQEQAKRAASLIKNERLSNEAQNLQAFRDASSSGRGRRLLTGRSATSLPEFEALSPTQQAQIRQERSLGGRFRSARAGAGNFVRNNRLGLSFAASLAAPALQRAGQAAGNNGLGNGLQVAGGAASGAAFGAIFGPQGAAIGALIGGLKTLSEVADGAANNVTALSKVLEDQQASATEVANSIQQVLSSQQRFAGLVGSGANPQQLRAAQRQVSSSVASISDVGLRAQVRDVLGDSTIAFEEGLDRIVEISAIQQQQTLEQAKITQGILKANIAETEGRGVINGFFGGVFGETDISGSQINEIAAEFAAVISQLNASEIDDVSDAIERAGKTLSDNDVSKAFRLIGLNADETGQLLEGLGRDFDLPQLLNALKKSIDVGREINESIELQAKFRSSIIESNRALDRVIGDINRISRIRGLQNERAFNSQQGEFDVRFAFAEFADPIAQGLVELAKANNAIAFEQKRGQEELAEEFRSGISEIVSAGGTPEAVQDLLRPLAENSNLQVTPDLLLDLIQTVETTSGSQNAQFDAVRSLLSSLLDSSLQLENNTAQSADAANRQFQIAQAQAREEQRQQNINFLGGIEGLLNSSPNRFQTFENRGILDRSSAQAGLFGGGASREAARGIVEFQEAFRDFGIDLRQIAPETERVVRDAVESRIADFASRFPNLNLDIAGITSDITSDLFGDNELTSQGIADAIGSNSTVSAIEANTDTTVRAIDFLTRELSRNSAVNDINREIAELNDSQKAFINNIRSLESSSANLRDEIVDAVSNSKLTGQITPDNIRALGGNQFDAFVDRRNDINRKRDRLLIGTSFGRDTPDEIAKEIADQLNELASSGSVKDIFQNSDGILRDFLDDLSFITNDKITSEIEKLANLGLVGQSGTINSLRTGIDNNQVLTDFNKTEFNRLEEQIKKLNDSLQNVRKGLSPDGSPLPTRPSGLNLITNSRATRASGTDFERAALNASSRSRAFRRREEIFNVSGGIGGFTSDENGNRVLSNQSQRISGVLSELIDVAGRFATKTDEEVIAALDEFDSRLEALGANLDNNAIQKFIEVFVEGRRQLLNERERQITSAAIGIGRDVAAGRDDPFRTDTDFNFQVDQALRTSQLLKQAGENAELFNDEFAEVANIKLPNTAVEKFAFGFKSAADEMTEALGNIQDVGARVADTLAEGFADIFLDAVNGSEDLGRSLRSLFSNLLADLARVQAQQAFSRLFSAAAGSFTGVQPASTGGQILKRNSGGRVYKFQGGGRVPTLLTSGEFVAGPDLVRQYGVPFFQALNSQSVNAANGVPASGQPLGGGTQGVVTGGSGVRDDRFHMLEAGSFVLNRPATERYRGIIGSIERGDSINTDRRRPQRAFWGQLIGGIFSRAITGAAIGGITAELTGGSFSEGAKKGAVGGAIAGTVGFAVGKAFNAGNGAGATPKGDFKTEFSQSFKEGLTFGLGKKKDGVKAGASAETASRGPVNLSGVTGPDGRSDIKGNFTVAPDQIQRFNRVNGTERLLVQEGQLFAKEGTVFNGKKINLSTGEVTRTGALNSATKQLVAGAALQLASNSLRPEDPSAIGGTNIPYQAGFIIDTDPNGTVTVMGENGPQKIKMGAGGDIQSLDDLKGIVAGYRRGGLISLDKFATSNARNRFLGLVRALALNTDPQVLATQGSFRRQAKSKNPVSTGVDRAISESLRIKGIQNFNDGGMVRDTAIIDTPIGPMIVGGGSTPNRSEVGSEIRALAFGRKRMSQNIATNAQRQVDKIAETTLAKAYMDQVGATVQGLNFGGSVLGGQSGMDSVPALLERGEFVQPSAAVGFFGEEFMRNVQNRNVGGLLKNIRRFEEGGRVDSDRGNFSIGSAGSSASPASVTDSGGLNGTITFDINFNVQSGGSGRQAMNASDAKQFEQLVARLQPAIKAAIANELRTGGTIANGIDNRG